MAIISKIKLGNDTRDLRDSASLHYIGHIAELPASADLSIITDLFPAGHIIAQFDHITVGTGNANYVATAVTSSAVTWYSLSEAAAVIPVQDVTVDGTSVLDTSDHTAKIVVATESTATTPKFGVVQTGNNITNNSGVISVPDATDSVKGVVQLSTAIPSTGAVDTKVATEKAVADAIADLPQAMIFKGTLGTQDDGGTVQTLPAAAAETAGDTYKVVTAGDYTIAQGESQHAEIGDLFICAKTGTTTYAWVLIPSGDVPAGTVTSVALAAQENSNLAIVSGSPITSNGTITIGVAADHTIPTDTKITGWDNTKTHVDALTKGTGVTAVSTTSTSGATAVPVLEIDSEHDDQLNVNILYVSTDATVVFDPTT